MTSGTPLDGTAFAVTLLVKLRGHGGHGEDTEKTPPTDAGLADRATRGVPQVGTQK